MNSPNDEGEQQTVNFICIVALLFAAFVLYKLKKIIFYKYTITYSGLEIKEVFRTEIISFSGLKMGLEKYPLIRYEHRAILMRYDDVMID